VNAPGAEAARPLRAAAEGLDCDLGCGHMGERVDDAVDDLLNQG
jgi:hypothetical protein